MTRDALVELAHRLGMPKYDKAQRAATPRELEKLIAAALAEEREQCAQVADRHSAPIVAAAIRKRT